MFRCVNSSTGVCTHFVQSERCECVPFIGCVAGGFTTDRDRDRRYGCRMVQEKQIEAKEDEKNGKNDLLILNDQNSYKIDFNSVDSFMYRSGKSVMDTSGPEEGNRSTGMDQTKYT